MSLRNIALIFVCAGTACAWSSVAVADGCYTCGDGSSEACKNYCRYQGEDTFQARKECERRGCKISGPSSCPSAANYKVCVAPPQKSDTSVAALPFCAAPSKVSG